MTDGTPLITLADIEAAIPPAMRGLARNPDKTMSPKAGLIISKGWRCAYIGAVNAEGTGIRLTPEQVGHIRQTLLPALTGVIRQRLAGANAQSVEAAVNRLTSLLNQIGVSSETERRVQDIGGLLRGLLRNDRVPNEFIESLDLTREILDPAQLSAGGTGPKPPLAITWIDLGPPALRHFRFDESALKTKTRPDIAQLSYVLDDAEMDEMNRLRTAGVKPPAPLFSAIAADKKRATNVIVRIIDNNAMLSVNGVSGHYKDTLEYLRGFLTDVTSMGKARSQIGITIIGEIEALVTDAYVGPARSVIGEDAATRTLRDPISLVKTSWRLQGTTFAPLPRVGSDLFEIMAPTLLKADISRLASEFAQKLQKAVKTST